MRITHNDGTVVEIGPGEAYVIEPRHSATNGGCFISMSMTSRSGCLPNAMSASSAAASRCLGGRRLKSRLVDLASSFHAVGIDVGLHRP